jgi:carbon starvation protein CstA
MGWGYLIYTGNISTLWPLFGTGNQLLATIALAVTTTFLINMGKRQYAWITAVPMCFVGVTTHHSGSALDQKHFLAVNLQARPGLHRLPGFQCLMTIFIRGCDSRCFQMRCGAGSQC